ncbi:MAG TPA: NADH-quinone oxidoreductase subunit M [Actinomycetales bacterium]
MSLLLALLVLLPLGAALALLLLPRGPGEAVAASAGVATSALTLAVSVLTLAAEPWASGTAVLDLNASWIPDLSSRLHVTLDGVSAAHVLLTTALGLAAAVMVARHPPEGGSVRSLVVCLLVVQAGAVATFLAADLILFFVAFEVVLVPMWAIIRWWGDPHDASARRDGAARFVLFTALGSALMLAGLLLVAITTGTTDLVELAAQQGAGVTRTTQVVAAALLVAGLAVKVPVWPLHTWLAPAHTAAPTVGSLLLAGVLLKMGSYGLVRVVVPVMPEGFAAVAPVLGALGVVGILWGGLACLVERDLKRLVAFSSVAHMGFVVLGIASGTPQGLQGAMFANIAHGVITGLLFVVAGGLKDRYGSASLATIGGGLRDRSPRLGALLAVGCVAGLGLPGLAGFWGELLAVYGAWQSRTEGEPALWRTLAVLAVVGTALAAAYLLRVLHEIWHGARAETDADAVAGPAAGLAPASRDATGTELVVGVPLAVVTVVLGLLPWLLLRLTEPTVRHLLGLGRGEV